MKNFIETKLKVEISLDCHDKTICSEWPVFISEKYCCQESALLYFMDCFSDIMDNISALSEEENEE